MGMVVTCADVLAKMGAINSDLVVVLQEPPSSVIDFI
ncbi:hypothetical protein L195_g062892, partial [Trifolium pratense]